MVGVRAPPPPTMPESDWAVRRIRKELKLLWIDPPAFCRPGPAPVTDLFHWEVVIDGPDGSPYAGGTFPVDVKIPKKYPMEPIKLTFKTKVYHPNIGPEGRMALDIFGERWSPAITMSTALLSVVSVLYDPLLDLPVRRDAALLYRHGRGLFEQKARRWTRRYASAPVASFCPAAAGKELLEEAASGGAVARRRSCGAGKWRSLAARLLAI
ncbi:ubiquitin-conjugating enzyme E2 11-like [Hordeum vulgare subsp. vulgare]|uniref:UBC core domain-containing protein n=1 Tax=Hordeum vulgare subsp. vulgare TaxID=112509 RepID=A0A8I6YEX4_HORVV|nr:ubiquitin-conjugating enzyme E2 11-like [Hordeum vulgare subsp. vulgare]